MGTLISYKGNTIENQYPEIPSFTQEEWDSLSENEKKQYNLIYITDDQAEGGQIVADEVTKGNYNSVSSNAVYEFFNHKRDHSLNTQTFKLVDTINISYASVIIVGYIGNIGNVSWSINLNTKAIIDLMTGAEPTSPYMPTITFDATTKIITITSTGAGIGVTMLGGIPID